jgi:molybdopterin converting factor small subunit
MRVQVPASLGHRGRPGVVELELADRATVRSVLEEVDERIPGSLARLLNGEGRLHRYVNVYVNGVDVRYGGDLDTPVRDSDEILIVPAISGG